MDAFPQRNTRAALPVKDLEKAPQCYEQNTAHSTLNHVPTNSVRINIRHRGPVRSRTAQISVIWTTHDIPGKTKLCDLFKLHYHKGGPKPHDSIFLQQINRYLQHMTGTAKYWWAEHSQERVMDLSWVFEDNEIWLSCLIDEHRNI